MESNGFDDRSWLDDDAHPHSDEMRLTERYHRTDHDTIEFTMTITDPKAYTQPWTSATMYLRWFQADELKARKFLVGKICVKMCASLLKKQSIKT